MKYLISKSRSLLIFDDGMKHEAMAQDFGGRQAILGAGFIDRNWKVFGKSEALNIGPSKEDQKLIDAAFKK